MLPRAVVRDTTWIVLISFAAFTAQPTIAAFQPGVSQSACQAVTLTSTDRFFRLAQHLEPIPTDAGAGVSNLDVSARKIRNLKAATKAFEAAQSEIELSFENTRKELAQLPLSSELAQRLDGAQSDYARKKLKLKSLLDLASNANDEGRQVKSLSEISQLLRPNEAGGPRAGPVNLPWRAAKQTIRTPIVNARALDVLLAPGMKARAAVSKDTSSTQVPPSSADLAETDEVQFTQAIQDKAVELGRNPTAIFNWVRNNVRFMPTYGSTQGADMTLQSQRGNAFDISSLLVALYRSANIPARYVYGTVEIPADKVTNWLGTSDALRAQSMLSQGGIPSAAIVSGGQISALRIEHIWVEAWVSLYPSRGGVSSASQGLGWAALDASFKSMTYTSGHDITQQIPLNADSLLNDATAGAVTNSSEGWIQGVNILAAPAALDDFSDRIRSTDGSLFAQPKEYFLPVATIVPATLPLLVATIPHKIIAASRLSSLPPSLQMVAVIRLYQTEEDLASDTAALTYELPLARLGQRRLSITHIPATDADAAVIASASASGATTLPAYLLQLKPQLQIDGQPVATNAALPMGQTVFWRVEIAGQTQVRQADAYTMTVGDEAVIGFNLVGVDEALVQRRMAASFAGPSEDLMRIALNFWLAHDLMDEIYGFQLGVTRGRLISHGIFASRLRVNYLFGIPNTAGYANRSMDVRHVVESVAAGDVSQEANFRRLSGRTGSAYEGMTFDILFQQPIGTAVSTVRLLADTMQQGARMYQVTSSNIDTVASLGVSETVKADVRNAVGAGMIAYVADQEFEDPTYRGSGYIIEDPVTGEGAYLIDGGSNGSEDQPCPSGTATAPVTTGVHLTLTQGIIYALIIGAAAYAAVRFAPGVIILALVGLGIAGAASAAMEPPISDLPPRLQTVWDQVYGPRYGIFRSNAPLNNPLSRTCDDATYKQVTSNKIDACNRSRSCKNAETCDEVSENLQRNSECGEARLNVMFSCWGGGDQTHWRVLKDDVLTGVDNCACKALGLGCAP